MTSLGGENRMPALQSSSKIVLWISRPIPRTLHAARCPTSIENSCCAQLHLETVGHLHAFLIAAVLLLQPNQYVCRELSLLISARELACAQRLAWPVVFSSFRLQGRGKRASFQATRISNKSSGTVSTPTCL